MAIQVSRVRALDFLGSWIVVSDAARPPHSLHINCNRALAKKLKVMRRRFERVSAPNVCYVSASKWRQNLLLS